MMMTVNLDMDKEWSYDEYCLIPDDGRRYQVLEGRLYVTPSPLSIHQLYSRRVQFFFYHFEVEGRGFVYNAPMDLLIDGGTPVQPDLIYLTREQKDLVKEKFIEGSPFLVVEILSPSTRALDRVKKMNLYAKNAIHFYLILDPVERTLEVFRFAAGHYILEHALDEAGEWEFEGRTLCLRELFAPL